MAVNIGSTLKELIEEVNNKVDKVSGKGLSTNDYTTAEKNKLAGIASGAEVNVQSDWSVTDTSSDAFIKNKPTIPSVGNGTITIKQAGAVKGTFTTNQSASVTIELDGGGSSSGIFNDDVEFNGMTTFNDDANFNSLSFFYGGAFDENDMPFPQAITSTNSQIDIQASRVGAYFNLTAETSISDELTIAGNSISLTSSVSSIITIEGHLRIVNPNTDLHTWMVLVSVYERNGTKPTMDTFAYSITTDRNGFRISDTASYRDTVYTGIICR